MKRFKDKSQLRNTSSEYWVLMSIETNTPSYENPITYQGMLIYSYNVAKGLTWSWVAEDYDGAPDANDHRHGHGKSIEDCIHQINEYILENEVGHE